MRINEPRDLIELSAIGVADLLKCIAHPDPSSFLRFFAKVRRLFFVLYYDELRLNNLLYRMHSEVELVNDKSNAFWLAE